MGSGGCPIRTLASTLLLTAVLLAPVAAAGPTICAALECNPAYKALALVEDAVDDLPLDTCQAEQCRPDSYVDLVIGLVGDGVVLP